MQLVEAGYGFAEAEGRCGGIGDQMQRVVERGAVGDEQANRARGERIRQPDFEMNNLLRRAYRSALAGEPQGELMVQRLSAHAAAKVVRAADPDACYLDLDWAPSGGLEPVAVADAFGDASAPAMEVAAVAASYTGNLHGDLLLRSGIMTVAPPHSGTKYRLDLDKALGTEIW